jgi:hypothetical protein
MSMASATGMSGAQRRAEVRLRVGMVAAAILFVVGLVVFFQVRASRVMVAPTPASKAQLAQQDAAPSDVIGKSGGTLVPAARRVAGAFMMSALRREQLATSWKLATADLRSTVTRKQWLAGLIPVAPFPVRSLASTGFKVSLAQPDKVLLQLLVLPPIGNKSVEPLRYDMTLEKHGGRWLVSNLIPYAPIPVQAVS